MRPSLLLALSLQFAASSFGTPPVDPPAVLPAKDDEPALPLKIPGYELRVLDQGKPVRLGVADTWLETSLPIFFYYPTADHTHALGYLRQARDELQRLGRKPDWSAAELQQVISELDSALRLLGANAGASPRS